MKPTTISILIISLFLISCAPAPEPVETKQPALVTKTSHTYEYITLTTSDNQNIQSTLFLKSPKLVIFLHQLTKDRRTYDDLLKSTKEAGFSVISIDLRGHGESDGDWRLFTETDFKNMIADIDAAVFYAESRINITEIQIIGASIGANLAPIYAAKNKKVSSLTLLSPGENYRGLRPSSSLSQMSIPVLIAVSEDDDYSHRSSASLSTKIDNLELIQYESSDAHGTDMLEEQDDLEEDILSFLI